LLPPPISSSEFTESIVIRNKVELLQDRICLVAQPLGRGVLWHCAWQLKKLLHLMWKQESSQLYIVTISQSQQSHGAETRTNSVAFSYYGLW